MEDSLLSHLEKVINNPNVKSKKNKSYKITLKVKLDEILDLLNAKLNEALQNCCKEDLTNKTDIEIDIVDETSYYAGRAEAFNDVINEINKIIKV